MTDLRYDDGNLFINGSHLHGLLLPHEQADELVRLVPVRGDGFKISNETQRLYNGRLRTLVYYILYKNQIYFEGYILHIWYASESRNVLV